MFKIGGTVYFLVEQKDGDITLEDGEIISHDDEIVCMTTHVGNDKGRIRFLDRKYAFSNELDGVNACNNLHAEFLKIRKATNRVHISMFDPKD